VIVTLTVNGEPRSAEVAGFESLLWLLRERLGLPGSKPACEQGECGSCSVVLDGELVCSCLLMAADAEGATVTTVEGLADGDVLHPVQQALIDSGAVQCGFCTPGLAVAMAHLLARDPTPSGDDTREALAGNLCRCTGYGAILRAVDAAAASTAGSPRPARLPGSPGGPGSPGSPGGAAGGDAEAAT
jgi:aerobic carbon-monoxide dehydrogenase small subunit